MTFFKVSIITEKTEMTNKKYSFPKKSATGLAIPQFPTGLLFIRIGVVDDPHFKVPEGRRDPGHGIP